MSKPQMYRTPTGADFRVVLINGAPWFVAKDVAEGLGYTQGNTMNMLKAVRDEEKGKKRVLTPGGPQLVNMINKAGLHRLMMRSDKPQARAFQDWIINEVLPQIEQHGMYMTVSYAEQAVENSKTPEGFLAQSLTFLDQAREIIASQAKQLAEQEPIVQAFDTAWKGESGTLTNFYQIVTGKYAYGPQVGALSRKLAEAGVLFKHHGVWHPTPEYADYFVMQPKGRDGVIHTWQVEVRSARRHELAAKVRPFLSV